MTRPAWRQETSPLWVRRLAPRPAARIRLFCFHYAGGSAAMFRDWPHALPAVVEPLAIQLPGRADRMAEKPYERMDPLVECLAELLTPDLDRPFAFFGYSMGARVAVNLAHALRKSGGPSPELLLVAASPGPSLPIAVPGWDQPDQALVTYLRDLGGTPAEVLANPELLSLLLPTVRADLTVVATCRRQPRAPLSMPVHALAGREDSYATPERMVAWHGETTGPFRLSLLPGGHFFVDSAARALVGLVASELVSLAEQMASGLSTASAGETPGEGALMTTPPPASERRIPHPQEWPVYDAAVTARATDLISRGRTFDYRYGAELSTLEERFSGLHDDRYALALNSGTSALLAAYHSLGIGPGDEVVVPTLTFLATASPLLLLGAIPVLADSDGPAGNVSARTIRPRLTARTRAIVVTHLFGHPCPMDEILALAAEYGLPVVEDCSHAHGSAYRGRPVGTFGDLAAFSIGGLKLVSGGMGGILLSRARRHHDVAILLSSFQQRSELTVADPDLRRLADVGLGGNLRISPIAAVLADSHLVRLPELVAAKQRNITCLMAALSRHPGVTAAAVADGGTMGGWYDAVLAVDPRSAGFTRDDLIAALCAEGIRARVPRTAPLHLASLFRGDPASTGLLRHAAGHISYLPDDLPHSVALHNSWLSLPATFFNDPAGQLVEPYLEGIDRALDHLSATAARRQPALTRRHP